MKSLWLQGRSPRETTLPFLLVSLTFLIVHIFSMDRPSVSSDDLDPKLKRQNMEYNLVFCYEWKMQEKHTTMSQRMDQKLHSCSFKFTVVDLRGVAHWPFNCLNLICSFYDGSKLITFWWNADELNFSWAFFCHIKLQDIQTSKMIWSWL